MKISQKSLKYPLGAFRWVRPKKNFLQKVITHQDPTFLGQKFFSKTNILGSQIFSDPLGLKIRKIAEMGHYGQLFLWGIFFSQPPQHTGQEKPWGTRSRGGVHMTPCRSLTKTISNLNDPNLYSMKKDIVHYLSSRYFVSQIKFKM